MKEKSLQKDISDSYGSSNNISRRRSIETIIIPASRDIIADTDLGNREGNTFLS